MTKLDMIKMMMFMAEGRVAKKWKSRIDNSTARSITQGLGTASHHIDSADITTLFKGVGNKRNALKKMMVDMKQFYKTKFSAINFSKLISHGKNGWVEFRYMGGPSYEYMFKESRLEILNYAWLLELGMKPDLYKKQYLSKLVKFVDSTRGYELKDLDAKPTAADKRKAFQNKNRK
jgi:hypothetical protein